MSNNLTLGSLQAAFDLVRGVLYYGTSDGITCGEVLMQEARPGMPQAVYCHPDDLEMLRRQISQRLVHLSEWKPTRDDILAMIADFRQKHPPVFIEENPDRIVWVCRCPIRSNS